MTIFGESRLGRIGYAIMILLMLGFDFAKQPIERYIIGLHDQAAEQLMAPRKVTPQTPQETGRINGKEMPFMLKAHEDIVRDIVSKAGKMSKAEVKAEIERRLKELGPVSSLSLETNKPLPAEFGQEIRDLDSRRSQLEAIYPVAVIAMTAITILGLLWMVSSRLRDIGWPQYYLWILIAPVFLPKFLDMPLAPIAAQGLNLLFHAGVILLALIPSEGDDDQETSAVPVTARETVIRRRPGQFGNRGFN